MSTCNIFDCLESQVRSYVRSFPCIIDRAHGYRHWQLLAERIDLYEFANGGHYLLRTRPAEAAQAVLRTTESLTSSLVATE